MRTRTLVDAERPANTLVVAPAGGVPHAPGWTNTPVLLPADTAVTFNQAAVAPTGTGAPAPASVTVTWPLVGTGPATEIRAEPPRVSTRRLGVTRCSTSPPAPNQPSSSTTTSVGADAYTHSRPAVSGTMAIPPVVRPPSNDTVGTSTRPAHEYTVSCPRRHGSMAVRFTAALIASAGTP